MSVITLSTGWGASVTTIFHGTTGTETLTDWGNSAYTPTTFISTLALPSNATAAPAATPPPPSVSSDPSTAQAAASSSSTPPAGTPVHKFNTGGVLGALFGGLVTGALVAIAALFYLRSRRHRNRKFDINEVMAYSSAPRWEEERKTMMNQLDEAQADRAQLRTYLQLADTQDPRDVVELFDKLNVSVRNSCILASSAVLKFVQSKSSWTTADATNLTQLEKDLDGVGELVLSRKGEGRRPEEFIPHAFRYIVNRALIDNLFGLFHPGVSNDENKLLWDMYRDVRSRDPQRLSARWRCLTYSAIDSRIAPSPSNWSNRFADDVLRDLSSIVLSLFGEIPSGAFPAKFRGELASIGTEAYKWNSSVKSTFKSLDFRPVLFTGTDPFDPASMTLYQNHKPEEFPPRHIVMAVTLALMSTSSVSSGEGTREEYVWQTKAEVLTEGFF